MNDLQLLIADDHEVVRMALRMALQPLSKQLHWSEAADAQATQERLAAAPELDLAIVDLNMPGSRGVATIIDWRRAFPAIPIIVLSADEDPDRVMQLMASGVAAFIPKSDSAAVMLQAVRLVLAGGTYVPVRLFGGSNKIAAATEAAPTAGLTPRQNEVLRELARGLPNKLIARNLGLTEATVKVHLLAIFRVLQVHNRTEAVLAAQRWLGRSALQPSLQRPAGTVLASDHVKRS